MKILIIGSSYCKHLKNFDRHHHKQIHGINTEFVYRDFSGKSFDYFLQRPFLIDEVLKEEPDYILSIFGGNSISTTVPKKLVLENCRDFYNLLSDKAKSVNPHCKIVASQVPLRFIYTPNKHNTPAPAELKKFRNSINHKLRSVRGVDHILNIGGPGRLDNETLYRDGIHFNNTGLRLQLELIVAYFSRLVAGSQAGAP